MNFLFKIKCFSLKFLKPKFNKKCNNLILKVFLDFFRYRFLNKTFYYEFLKKISINEHVI